MSGFGPTSDHSVMCLDDMFDLANISHKIWMFLASLEIVLEATRGPQSYRTVLYYRERQLSSLDEPCAP